MTGPKEPRIPVDPLPLQEARAHRKGTMSSMSMLRTSGVLVMTSALPASSYASISPPRYARKKAAKKGAAKAKKRSKKPTKAKTKKRTAKAKTKKR